MNTWLEGWAHSLFAAGSKQASTPRLAHSLSGRLFLSQSGWIMLSVPNAMVRGAFDALDEPGVELPLKNGRLDAHISVIRPEELDRIGGPYAVTERGHTFRYTLGPLETVVPAGWDGVERVWFIRVESPDLEALRVSYGLTPRPNHNRFHYHITVGVRRKGTLAQNRLSKVTPHAFVREASGTRLLRERLAPPRDLLV